MRALLPRPLDEVDDQFLLDSYAAPAGCFTRFNFVSSLDGSATLGGLSGAMGSPADFRVFSLLRRLADVILVGAGTVRAEGYDGPLLDDQSLAWRQHAGKGGHPPLGIISRSARLEPQAPVFTRAPGQVFVFHSAPVPESRRLQYPAQVQLIRVPEGGDGGCDPAAVLQWLHGQGLNMVHAEGGPRIFGQFIASGLVDSLCLSFSPLLAGGQGPRISQAAQQSPQPMVLHHLLEQDSMLLAEYRKGTSGITGSLT